MDDLATAPGIDDLLKRRGEILDELASVQYSLRRLGHSAWGLPKPLAQEHVSGCRVFADRAEILDMFPKGGRVAEIGVATGKFSREIISRMQPSELHLFDLQFSKLDSALKDDSRVTLHRGDSSTLLNELPDGYFDLVYIDGDHSLSGVARDVGVAVNKVRPDGTLGFNDYTLWSIREMIPYGVTHAVNRLCVNARWRMVCLSLSKAGYHDVFVQRMDGSR